MWGACHRDVTKTRPSQGRLGLPPGLPGLLTLLHRVLYIALHLPHGCPVIETAAAPRPASRGALATLGAAALIGILGDIVFRGENLGINMPLWILALLAASRLLRSRTAEQPAGQSSWLLLALGFASCLAIRDAENLQAFNVLAIMAALALPNLAHYAADARLAQLSTWIRSAARGPGMIMAGAPILAAQDAEWSRLRGTGKSRVGPVVLGLVLATPVVLIFGALFSQADPAFAAFAENLVGWDIGPAIQHTVIAGAFTWLAAGLLRAWLWKPGPAILFGQLETLTLPSVGVVPVGMVVGSMLGVFTIFVALQARYLFGGEAVVLSTTGLGYAEYARRGFFEMVTASTLAIPVLFVADVLMEREDSQQVRRIRLMSGVQLALVAVVMISALARMKLYVDAYGLTADRIVATAILAWLGLVIGWFSGTVLRGRRNRFTWGAVMSGFAVLAGLNAVNPDALIARVNTGRESVVGVDAALLQQLRADAAPVLVARLEQLAPAARCALATSLKARYAAAPDGWRNWNLARARARAAVSRLNLDQLGCPAANPDASAPGAQSH